MNLLGASGVQITRNISSGVNLMLTSDKYISYDRTNGNITLVLPLISDYITSIFKSGNSTSIDVFLSDITPSVSVNTITFLSNTADNIGGLSSVSYSTLYDSFSLLPTPNGWLLLNKSTSGGGSSIYNGASPTTVTVGGLASGTNILGLTYDQIFQAMLVPYISPAFSSLTSNLFSTYEVGANLTSGLSNVSYAVSTPSNIKTQPPFVGIPSSNIVGITFPINPFQLMASGTFVVNILANTTSNIPTSFTISCQGTNSNNATFTISNSLSFSFRNYWGFNASASLTGVDILALQSSQLKSGFSGSYTMPSNATPRYLYFVFDNSFGYPTTIFDSTNGFNATADFTDLGTVVAPNQFGVSQTWRIIRSLNQTSGAGGFQYLLS